MVRSFLCSQFPVAAIRVIRIMAGISWTQWEVSLARPADQIALLEVLVAVEGPVAPAPCLHRAGSRKAGFVARPVWRRAARAIEEVFSNTTIADMAKDGGSDGPGISPYRMEGNENGERKERRGRT